MSARAPEPTAPLPAPSEHPAAGALLPRPTLAEALLIGLGIALVHRHRWWMDDAFVYFRYVDNLLFLDAGLVYNAGEYVEGFSSPLHCLLLIALRALRVGFDQLIPTLGCAAFAGFGYALVVLNRRLAPPRGPVFNLPLAYLALHYGASSFFTSGLETPLAQLWAPLFALFLLRPGSRPLAVAVALAPLVRPELALGVAVAAAWAAWRERRVPWLLIGATLATSGAWLVFRIVYYADLLPNTFYLKNATKPRQGWLYLRETLGTYHGVAVAAATLGLSAVARAVAHRRGSPPPLAGTAGERCAMLAIALAVTAYVVKVGGTHVHYWYLAFPAALATCALAGLPERALRDLAWRPPPAAVAAAALAFALLVGSWYPPQLSAHPLSAEAVHTPQRHVDDPLLHRRHPDLRPESWAPLVRVEDQRAAGRRIAEQGYPGVTSSTWCRAHYVGYGERFVHGFGLTEAVLARTRAGAVKPGHKRKLLPLGHDIARLQSAVPWPDRGLYRAAVARGDAPPWVEPNLASLEVIERKIYNRHAWGENLRLALTFPPPVERVAADAGSE